MDGADVTVGGSISEIREITTKNGSKMAFVKLADTSGELELVLFPKIYKPGELMRDQVVIATGKINSRDGQSGASLGELKILPDKIEIISVQDAKEYKPGSQKPKAPFLSRGFISG